MNDALLVNINQRLDDLTYVHSGLMLSQSFSSFNEVFQGIVSAVLEKNINILFVLESVNKLNDVLMFESFVYFDLNEQLIPLSFLVDRFFGYDFGCIESVVLLIYGFITLSEPSSPE